MPCLLGATEFTVYGQKVPERAFFECSEDIPNLVYKLWMDNVNNAGGLCSLVLFKLKAVVELGPCTAVLISLLDFY